MTQESLIAFLPRSRTLSDEMRARFHRTTARLGLSAHHSVGDALIATRGPAVRGRAAVLVGELYDRAGNPAAEPAAPGGRLDFAAPLPPGHGCWGNYLAIIAGEASHSVVRAPFGDLPCFWIEEQMHVVAATSVALLEACLVARPAVDWRRLAVFMLSPQMRNGATCLEGVRELPAGFSLAVGVDGRVAVFPHWSPWDFAGAADALDSFTEASDIIAGTIDRVVAARCANLHNPVLLLSGGLDSSALAASLARQGRRFSALTMVTRHRSGDERLYARLVAEATGARLTECERSTADVDWDDQTPRGLVRPSARLFRQPTLRAAHRLARETGAGTIIDGGGGDDVFCSLTSVVPLLDRIAIEGLGRGSWRTAREMALRADVAMVTVLAKAVRRRLSGRVAYRWPIAADFLTADARELASCAIAHPWLDPPPGELPGRAAHVALVLDALALSEDDSLDPAMRTISPLVAQPSVEAALRVRSWLWFRDGRNRALIRRGFAPRLPSTVVARSGKGTPGGFVADFVQDHRVTVREMLLGGALVARGIVDQAAIEAALRARAIARDGRLPQLLAILDAERWARLWSG
jgi:asparagine synthase (glutamine-hydrolysing)